jgi:hypothetical protein
MNDDRRPNVGGYGDDPPAEPQPLSGRDLELEAKSLRRRAEAQVEAQEEKKEAGADTGEREGGGGS